MHNKKNKAAETQQADCAGEILNPLEAHKRNLTSISIIGQYKGHVIFKSKQTSKHKIKKISKAP